MKEIRNKRLFIVCLVLVMSAMIFLVPGHAKDKATQSRDVVIALPDAQFYCVGGDPATSNGGTGTVISHTVYDSLTKPDKDQNYLPALAKSWKVAPDWSYIDIVLKEGVKFHNGAEVTAEDVKYTVETCMYNKKLRFVFGPLMRRKIKDIEVQGPYKLRLNMKSPYPWWDVNFATLIGIFPKKYREAVGDEGFADKPIGAGPFKWVDYKQDQWFTLEAVKDHYRQPPEIDKLKCLLVPEASTRLAMLKAGEADIAGILSPQAQQVRNDPNLKLKLVKDVTGSCLLFADQAFPSEPSPWHDKRVRLAASLAIDRKMICEKVRFGLSAPLGEVISPITKGYDPSVKADPYDPEAAKALLDEAGYSKGFKTVIHTIQANKFWVEAVVSNLADVGIDVDLKLYESRTWYGAFMNKKFRGLTTFVVWGLAAPHPGMNATQMYTRKYPWCYTTTPEIEKVIMKSMFTSSDEELIAAGRQISKLIRESRIRMPLWSNHTAWGLGPRIKDWEGMVGFTGASRLETIKLKH